MDCNKIIEGLVSPRAPSLPQPGMTKAEYELVHNVVKKRGQCNFLVFGLGYDSVLWNLTNEGGVTVFLENKTEWIKSSLSKNPELKIVEVFYGTKKHQHEKLMKWFDSGNIEPLMLNLPEEITRVKWDAIFVDSPKNKVGRMKSIYMANELKSQNYDIFVHDCNRTIESIYCRKFLGKPVEVIQKLAHFTNDG